MGKYTFILYLFLANNLVGQVWYSKLFDPFNGMQESAISLNLVDDSFYLRGGGNCSEDILCSIIGNYLVDKDSFIAITKYDSIQTGGKSIMILNNKLYISSQESIFNKHVSISSIEKDSLKYSRQVDLSINNSRYFNYTISNSILFNDKLIIGAQTLDSLTYIDYSGWFNYQEQAILFIVDSLLTVDTILLISPDSGAFLKIEDISVMYDSILFVSFYEKYLKKGITHDYLENRKVIHGYNKNFNKIFEWIGPDFDHQESLTCLTIDSLGTIYLNYYLNYRTYLMAINSNGTLKWQTALDSVIGINLYSIKSLLLAKNGDILGAGIISSIEDELGESGFLFRVDSNGNLIWKRAFRVNQGFDKSLPSIFPFVTGIEDIVELENGDLLSAGYVRNYFENSNNSPIDFDLWLLRTSKDGCLNRDCPYIKEIITKRNYIPLVSHDNVWVVDVFTQFLPPAIFRYSFSEDSLLIEGKHYHELLYSVGMVDPWLSSEKFFREENGRIYYWYIPGQDEQLLYNFEFMVGDTLPKFNDGSENHREIVDIGTIQLNDGEIRKHLILQCTTDAGLDSTQWIEGMGDRERLFWTESFCSAFDDEGTTTSIRCFSTGGQLLYVRPDLEDCYITSVQNIYNQDFAIFPNPSRGELQLSFNEPKSFKLIQIYDIVGKLVLSSEQINTNSKLDVSMLPSGYYFGLYIFSNNVSGSFSFILNN